MRHQCTLLVSGQYRSVKTNKDRDAGCDKLSSCGAWSSQITEAEPARVLFNAFPLSMGSEHFRPICLLHLAKLRPWSSGLES